MLLGAGRETKESIIDPSVGLIFEKKVSDYVRAGDVICQIHHNNYGNIDMIMEHLNKNINISKQKQTKSELIYKIIK